MNSEHDNTRAAKFAVDAHSEQIDVSKSYGVDVSMISRLARGFRGPFRGRRSRGKPRPRA